MSFKNLETTQLILRPLLAEDAAEIFRYRSDPEICRYQFWEPANITDVEQFVEMMTRIQLNTPGTWFQLAICPRDTGGLVGDLGLRFPHEQDHEVEFGITLAPEHQGRGFATEALEAVFTYLFDTLAKQRIFGSVDPRNSDSIRLMERLGMRREAHFRERLWFKGEWADDIIYGILRREWQRR